MALVVAIVCLSGLSEAASTKKKPMSYVVVKVKDTAGATSYDVIPLKEIKQRSSDAMKEYRQAVRDWTKAKADARKNKEKFAQKKPLKPSVTKVGAVFKNEEKAEAYAQKQRDKQQVIEERKKKPSDDKPKSDGDDEKGDEAEGAE